MLPDIYVDVISFFIRHSHALLKMCFTSRVAMSYCFKQLHLICLSVMHCLLSRMSGPCGCIAQTKSFNSFLLLPSYLDTSPRWYLDDNTRLLYLPLAASIFLFLTIVCVLWQQREPPCFAISYPLFMPVGIFLLCRAAYLLGSVVGHIYERCHIDGSPIQRRG